ncbi:MAG: ATP-binding protein [Paracoccaceae bacterium]|nr:ATP-binding protein [Paracoccaceae bacterium]
MKIVTKDEPLQMTQVVVGIYGDPGIGKTSVAFSTKNPLLLDFDRGAHRSAFRGDTVQIESWDEVSGMSEEDLKGYDTIVIDTVGRQLDSITAYLAANDPKMVRRTGELTLQGYGALKGVFNSWLRRTTQIGKDIVLIAHAKEEKSSGDETNQRPDIQGGSYAEILKATDMLGYMYRGRSGAVLDFSPTERHVGKNAPGFEPFNVPDLHAEPDWFATVLQSAKDTLNSRNSASKEVATAVSEVREIVEAAQSADEINELVATHITDADNKAAATQIGKLVKSQAKTLGLSYDKQAKAFVAPPEAASAAA